MDVMGHMSCIVRLYLKWPEDQSSVPSTVIVKVPTEEEKMKTFALSDVAQMSAVTNGAPEDDGDFLRQIHDVETATYAMLKKASSEGLAIPHFYDALPFSSTTPCILMEDINPCTTTDLVDGFNDNQIFKIVDQLVALHVFAFTHDGWTTLGLQYEEDAPAYKQYMGMIEGMRGFLMAEYPQLKDGLTLLYENYMRDSSWCLAHSQHYKKNGILRTFVHGDLWSANILWRGESVAAIVDWTLCHPGSLTEDLQRVLVTCCSVERRQRMTRALLEYYFGEMTLRMKEKSMKMPFTFEELEEDYRRTLPFVCGQTVFAVGLWLHTDVIRKGKPNDDARADEMVARLGSFVEETALSHKWTSETNSGKPTTH